MLISNQLAVIVLVLVYLLLAEKIIAGLVSLTGVAQIDDFMPGGSATATLSSLVNDGLLSGTLSAGSLPWWMALLVFTGYAVVAVLGGIVVAQRRDVNT
jgi:hypothetical protein